MGVGVGAEEDGGAVEAGFKDIVATDMVDVAAGDEGEAAERVADGELAHSVDEKDPLPSPSGFEVAPAEVGDTHSSEELSDFFESLRMAGDEDDKPAAVLQGGEEKLLFGGVGAADG